MRGRDLTIVLGVAIVAVILFGIIGLLMYTGYGYGGMMRGPGPGWYGWMFPLMALGMFLFWGLIIGGIIWLVFSSVGRQSLGPAQQTNRARCFDLLRERYARGEITREQYQQMFKDLEEGGACPYTEGPLSP